MKKTLIAATGASLVLLLGACSKDADTSDFKKQTADFINGKEVEEKTGTDFEDASCEEPASTAIGTTYTCTATATTDGSKWTFDVEITSKNGFTVQDANPVDDSATGATTTVADDDATTTTG
ncbi:MAG: DUF4333 domain-containing protein [Ilumatobacteraceae bacterium]